MGNEIKITLAKQKNLKHLGKNLFVGQPEDEKQSMYEGVSPIALKLRSHIDKLSQISEEFKKKMEEPEEDDEDDEDSNKSSKDDEDDDLDEKSKDEKPKKFKKSDGDNHQVEMFIR